MDSIDGSNDVPWPPSPPVESYVREIDGVVTLLPGEVTNLPVNILPFGYAAQVHGQSSYSSDDPSKAVAITLNQGSVVKSMDFHPVQQILLLVGTNTGEITLWELGSQERLAVRNFEVWDLGKCSMPLQASLANDYSAPINRVIWSPDGTLFGVAYSRHIVHIYSYHGGDDVRNHLEIEAHDGSVNDLAFCYPNKQLSIVTCGDDRAIKVWDAATGIKQYTLESHEAPVYSVCARHKENSQPSLCIQFNKEGILLAVSTNDNGVKILANADGMRLLQTVESRSVDASVFGSPAVVKMARRKSLPPEDLPCPWLLFVHGRRSNKHTFYSVTADIFRHKRIPEISGRGILTNFDEWVVFIDEDNGCCSIVNIRSLEEVKLPSWDIDVHRFWVLSGPPTEESCVVGFVSEDSRSLTFCHPGDAEWVEHVFQPFVGTLLSSTIRKGRIYCYTVGNKLLVLDIVDHTVEVKHISRDGRTWSPLAPRSTRSVTFLVESCDDIFLLRMHGDHMAYESIWNVDTFKFDFSVLEWVEVAGLGDDRTFFVNESTKASMSCSASEFGTLGNAVYFTGDDNASMHVISLEDNFIYCCVPCPFVDGSYAQTQWILSRELLHRIPAKTLDQYNSPPWGPTQKC